MNAMRLETLPLAFAAAALLASASVAAPLGSEKAAMALIRAYSDRPIPSAGWRRVTLDLWSGERTTRSFSIVNIWSDLPDENGLGTLFLLELPAGLSGTSYPALACDPSNNNDRLIPNSPMVFAVQSDPQAPVCAHPPISPRLEPQFIAPSPPGPDFLPSPRPSNRSSCPPHPTPWRDQTCLPTLPLPRGGPLDFLSAICTDSGVFQLPPRGTNPGSHRFLCARLADRPTKGARFRGLPTLFRSRTALCR